jgi:hypothetical protein
MNTNEPPPFASASGPRDHNCYDIDPNAAALKVFADDGHNYLLAYAQFLYAESFANPALEQDREAPPEKMLIRFAQADAVVFGSGLRTLEQALQKYELKHVRSADRRFAAPLHLHVDTVTITFTKDNV